jgi:UTP:GlnB (protein PII) uridylyltransferase
MASLDVDDEYDKLIIRMNPPRVSIDNNACENTTLVKVDSANKHGILLEVVQVLTDLNLTIAMLTYLLMEDGSWMYSM